MFCQKCCEDVPYDKILLHLKDYHPDEKDLDIPCPECCKHFKTAPSYRKHWYKFHHIRDSTAAVSVSPTEQQCPEQGSATESGDEPSGEVRCTEPPSKRRCTEQDEGSPDHEISMNSDIVIQSSDFFKTSTELEQVDNISVAGGSRDESSTCESESESSSSSDSDSDHDGEEIGAVLHKLLSPQPASVILKSASSGIVDSTHKPSTSTGSPVKPLEGEFVLKLIENCHASQKSVKDMMVDTKNLVRHKLENFAAKIDKELKSKDLSVNEPLNVEKGIESEVSELFKGVETADQQMKYFVEEHGLILPDRIPLGSEFRRVRRKKKKSIQTAKIAEEFMYVKVEKVVERLVNHPDYKYFVENTNTQTNSHFLDSYMKGSQSKNNPVLQEQPDALRFVLYYDDLEVCCPIKSRSGNQKLAAFYLYMDNIPHKYRSNLGMICLVALAKSDHLKSKSYGIDCATECIVQDLKKFENGVLINGKPVFGTLIAFIGDNLGVHAVGGFKEGFTACHGCRFCTCSFEEMQNMFREDSTRLRDIESHNQQCEEVQTARGKNAKKSKEYGINRNSSLNSLRSFHVVLGMPPDIMHDILEGILPLAIKKLLRILLYVKEKFTLHWLNQAIRDFDIGYLEAAVRPSELKKDHIMSDDTTLHQSASQTWLLARILPLIIGQFCSIDDKYFKNYLDCLEITRIVFSYEVSEWMVHYLADLIEVYPKEFKSLYHHLIPKHHFLIHYPGVILRMGSLMNYLCLRCEAKHKYFKTLVLHLGNFKNVAWSLSLRHQITQAIDWSKSLKKPNLSGPCTLRLIKDTEYASLLPSWGDQVVETNWLKFEGNKFIPDKCYICVGVNDFLPVFAAVKKIVIHPHVVFICQEVHTVRRSVHLAAYEIQVLSELCLFKPGDMCMHTPLTSHKVKDAFYIPVKFCCQDTIL